MTDQPPTITTTPGDLWGIHVHGPNETYACASRADAIRCALWTTMLAAKAGLEADPAGPIVWAVPIPWTATGLPAHVHTSDLARHEATDPRWTGRQPLTEVAAEVLGTGTVGP